MVVVVVVVVSGSWLQQELNYAREFGPSICMWEMWCEIVNQQDSRRRGILLINKNIWSNVRYFMCGPKTLMPRLMEYITNKWKIIRALMQYEIELNSYNYVACDVRKT